MEVEEQLESEPNNRQIRFRGVPRKEAFVTGIDLLSDEERMKMEKRRERFGAQKGGEFEVKVMEQSEKDQQMQKRAQRFGLEYSKDQIDLQSMKKLDLWEEHKEADANAQRRQEAIYIYGLDLMSTSDVMKYFEEYGPSHVEWIDDSSCNIVFGDPYSTTRALVGKGEIMSDPSLLNVHKHAVYHVWYKGQDYKKGDKMIPLAYRMATVEDVADPSTKKPSRYLWQLDHNPKFQKRGLKPQSINTDRQQQDRQKEQGRKLRSRQNVLAQNKTINKKKQKKKRKNQFSKFKQKYLRTIELQEQQEEILVDYLPPPRRYIASVVEGLGPGTDDEDEKDQKMESNDSDMEDGDDSPQIKEKQNEVESTLEKMQI